MFVITEALIDQKMVDKNDAKNYMERELRRFRNDLLHDPISRVARDPLRKLAPEDRLIQALNLVNKSNLEIIYISRITSFLGVEHILFLKQKN